jgi:hypothetical protein
MFLRILFKTLLRIINKVYADNIKIYFKLDKEISKNLDYPQKYALKNFKHSCK